MWMKKKHPNAIKSLAQVYPNPGDALPGRLAKKGYIGKSWTRRHGMKLEEDEETHQQLLIYYLLSFYLN